MTYGDIILITAYLPIPMFTNNKCLYFLYLICICGMLFVSYQSIKI